MIIKIIKHYIILLVVFFSWVGVANAGVVINEIQLSPTEERFIELYNSGSSVVDLSNWYIQRKTATGTEFGSLVSKTLFANKSISAGGYFLISKNALENSDIVYSNLTLTESNSIQLKNSNQADPIDKVGWGDVTDCGNICAPNPTDGNSIQKTSNGDWIIASHTPRTLNSDSENNVNNEEQNNTSGNINDTSSSSTSTSSTTTTTDAPAILKITTKIISPKIVTAGIPFSLSSLTTTNRGETYAVGKFVWNFGDGMVKEVGQSNPFEYVYEYSGEYALTISYYDSVFSINPDAVDRLTIKVVPSGINISSVGTIIDPFVEIENKSSYEIILSNWVVIAGIHYFIIPEGTTLLPNKKIKLSPTITGFVGEDIKSVIITNPNKEIIATYPTEIKKPIQKITSVSKTANINPVPTNNLQDDSLLKNSQVINLNDLGASAQDSGINIKNSIYPIIGLLVVIGLGIASFLLIKKKRDVDDYVEKGIRAEDMTIIE